MQEIVWRPEYTVRIAVLDEQHRQLVETINLLNNIIDSGDAVRLKEVFDRLMAYITLHFNTEEQLMALHHYPRLEEHAREHEACRLEVLKYRASFEKGEKDIEEKLIFYMTDWLFNHLFETDREYVEFFAQKGLK